MLHSVALLHPSSARLITRSADSASASDARDDTIEDVQVWHKDGDDDERK